VFVHGDRRQRDSIPRSASSRKYVVGVLPVLAEPLRRPPGLLVISTFPTGVAAASLQPRCRSLWPQNSYAS
jgi:hypothetical protein